MPKTTTRAILTLNPLKLVIEQTVCPSSTFPAAPVAMDVDGSDASPETIRPLAKAEPANVKLRRFG
jgi:hypothetical protein